MTAIVKWKAKTCLTCAFCTRNKNTWLSNFLKPELSRWKNQQESLTSAERDALNQDDDSFIENEIREAKSWDEKLEQEKERRRQQRRASMPVGVPYYDEENFIINKLLPRNVNEEAEKYGMPPRPKAPDDDYLSCYHEQWDESQDADIRGNRIKILKHKRCTFHYPFKKTSGESLAACEENRKDGQERRRFYITTALIVVGIFVTLVLGLLAIRPDQKKEAAKSTLSTPAPVESPQSKPKP